MMDLGLKDRAVLVTGASGGIGRAIASAFGEQGARVICHTHRQLEPLRAWVAEQPWRDRARCVQADIRVPAEIEAALQALEPLDICIANAGTRPREPEELALHEAGEERIRETIEANLLGAIWTARAFLRHIKADGSSLLFIGSTAARFGEKGYGDYAAAKAGLHGLVQTLKNEIVGLDPRGRVNLLEPGWTATHVPRPALHDPDQIRRVVRTMPLRQLARAQDIARAALWLSSPTAARHITGQTLTVAGGMEGRLLWEQGDIDPEAIRADAQP